MYTNNYENSMQVSVFDILSTIVTESSVQKYWSCLSLKFSKIMDAPLYQTSCSR